MEWEAADTLLTWTYNLKLEVIILTDNANNYDLHLGNLIYLMMLSIDVNNTRKEDHYWYKKNVMLLLQFFV